MRKDSVDFSVLCARAWIRDHIEDADPEATQEGLPELLKLVQEIEAWFKAQPEVHRPLVTQETPPPANGA